ncbi:MAG TPA: putative toxin-antitoxin system toxin component, PIN family [Solirubrobacterales bacterium]
MKCAGRSVRRAVLDSGVFVSALINPNGTPALLLARAHGAEYEMVTSPLLLSEVGTVLQREKFRRYASIEAVTAYLRYIRRLARIAPDPDAPAPISCADPQDNYLLALAYAQKAVLVTGDSHLLDIVSGAPICAPADFLAS